MSFIFFSFALNFVLRLTGVTGPSGAASQNIQLGVAFILILLVSFQWWRDVIREAKTGHHTVKVQTALLIGFLLFLVSEIMLFASFFWAFFHASLAPGFALGAQWPPTGILAVNPWTIPLLGSTVLLASGFILTLGHHAFIQGSKALTVFSFIITVFLGLIFIVLQMTEYYWSEVTIADSVYGSVFFMTTGLHALHVIIGVLFLCASLIRTYNDEFTTEHHIGLEFSIYYWHLVDVVWLLVFLIYYWWGA